MNDARHLLQAELARRCEKNPRYSLRAFARALGLSHTVLSLVLSGKRPLSKGAVLKVSDALGLEPAQRRALIEARNLAKRLPKADVDDNYHQLSLDTFAVISDWYHYAILSLLELPNARLEPRWISARLGIGIVQAKLAVERLTRVGLLEQDPTTGRWRQAGKPLRIDNTQSTAATRRFHRQVLEKALESLDNDPQESRDFNSITFAVSPSQLPYARASIRAFRRELVQELEKQKNPEAVYQLSIQLFPATRAEKT